MSNSSLVIIVVFEIRVAVFSPGCFHLAWITGIFCAWVSYIDVVFDGGTLGMWCSIWALSDWLASPYITVVDDKISSSKLRSTGVTEVSAAEYVRVRECGYRRNGSVIHSAVFGDEGFCGKRLDLFIEASNFRLWMVATFNSSNSPIVALRSTVTGLYVGLHKRNVTRPSSWGVVKDAATQIRYRSCNRLEGSTTAVMSDWGMSDFM